MKKTLGRPRKLNKITTDGDLSYLYLTNGEIAIIDTDVVDFIKEYTWRMSDKGYVETHVIDKDSGKRKRKFLHHLILGISKPNIKTPVDHINMSKLDNKCSNLRVITNSLNQLNRALRSDNTSGITGITRDGNSGWKSRINYQGIKYEKCFSYDDLYDAIEWRVLKFEEFMNEASICFNVKDKPWIS